MLRAMLEPEDLAKHDDVNAPPSAPSASGGPSRPAAAGDCGVTTRSPRSIPDTGAPAEGGRRAVWLALWAAWYAAYRFYYAFGGQIGMVGRPAPAAHFRDDNLVGAAIILSAGLVPLAAAWGRGHRSIRGLVITVGWVATVGSCMHGLTLEILRILSLSGLHSTHYPPGLWVSLDRHQADLQDALFNEPWFLITGLLYARFTLTALKPTSRPLWQRSAAIATLLSLVVGVLSGLGAIPTLRVG